jgi:hypothetical protein
LENPLPREKLSEAMSRFSRLQRESSEIYPGSESDGNKSKNLVTERNRRTRIKTGLFSLSARVPKISKVDIVLYISAATKSYSLSLLYLLLLFFE